MHTQHTYRRIESRNFTEYVCQDLSTSTSTLMLSSHAEKRGPTGVNLATMISKAEGAEEPSNLAGLLH